MFSSTLSINCNDFNAIDNIYVMSKISDLDSFFEEKREKAKKVKIEQDASFKKTRQEEKRKEAIFNSTMTWTKDTLVSTLQQKLLGTRDTILWNSLADEMAAYRAQKFSIGKSPYRPGGYFQLTYKPYQYAPLIIKFECNSFSFDRIVYEKGIRMLSSKDSVKKEITFDEFTNEYVESIITEALKSFLNVKK